MDVRGVLSILALAASVIAQDSRGICGWQEIRAGVVRDSLYLEGGLQQLGTWNNGKWDSCVAIKPSFGSLFKLNFSTPFDVHSTNLRGLFQQINETLDSSAPIYVDGTMFADDDEFYTVGGMAYFSADSNPNHGQVHAGLYAPNAAATGFQQSINTMYPVSSSVTQYITHGAGVSIPSENLGFYFGGLASSNNSRISFINAGSGSPTFPGSTVNTMMRVDTSSANAANFTQSSIPTGAGRAGASMAWIPTGARGLLVVIGGVQYPADLYSFRLTDAQKNANTNSTVNINTVRVYDIAAGTWYTQNTTGAATPPPFSQACVVVASANDSSSHQIYVYGGWDGTQDLNPYDDVWILSVPSFKWIRAATGTTNHGRYAHSCAKPYPNQMISVGGVTPNGAGLKTPNIIDVFDLNTLNWTGTYDPTKWSEYKIPKVVTDVIGGGADGGSSDVATTMDSNLRAVFSSRYGKTITKYYPYATAPTAQPPKKSHAVAIAVPIVVVVVLLVTGVMVWYCFFSAAAKKKRSQKASDDTLHQSNNFVSRWINNSAQFPPPPKSIISSDATEIGESLSPRAEVPAGFSYFSPYARQGGIAAELGSTPLQNQHAANATYSRAASPGSPGSHGSAELEAPTPPPQMSQIVNSENRNTEVFRTHPLHVPSIGAQSVSSTALSSRYANARAPSDTNSNAIELPPNQSTEQLGLAPPHQDLSRTKSDKSVTETSTDISAPTDIDGDAATENQSALGSIPEQTTGQVQTATQQTVKSYPPTALSNVTTQPNGAHHRSTSSASSGMAITMSPSSNPRSVSPGEDERQSAYIDSLPERLSQGHHSTTANNSNQSAYEANTKRIGEASK